MKKTWQELTLEYAATGLRPCEVARKVEKELGLTTNMYDKVYFHIRRHFKKDEIINNDKRVIVQNQEPEYHTSKWDGCQVLKFGLIGDTQFGSKYAQITYLHQF